MKTQPKISSNTHQFWKTPKFFKNTKILVLNHEIHEWERIRSLPSKEKLEISWRILEEEVSTEKESVWKRNSRRQIERDRRNERRIAIEKYIDPSVNLDSWGIKRYWGSCRGRCRGSGLRQLRYQEGIEQQRVRFKNRSSINPSGVEELSRR